MRYGCKTLHVRAIDPAIGINSRINNKRQRKKTKTARNSQIKYGAKFV